MESGRYSDNRIKRYIICFIILSVMLGVLFVVSIKSGSVNISWKTLFSAFSGKKGIKQKIIMDIRLPRTIAAILMGGALGIAGFMLQSFFNNPIAGPFVLGISSGAKLAVAVLMIFFMKAGSEIGSIVMIFAAFIGAMVSMSFILIISSRIRNSSILIVCGVMIGYICSAITDLMINFAADSDIVNLHSWSVGSFSGIGWNSVRIISVVIILCVIAVFLISKPMEAYSFGESYAKSMGVNIKRFRLLMIILSSVLSACVTAFAGPISFLGVAVPHLIRNIFKTSKPILMIPACFLGGAVFCTFSDLMARILFAPTEISISTVTSILGAPVVIFVMIRGRRRRDG
ncbi:MAG: iron ABC transporter permease [Eubacterium sp.]|nr:iron ABC transporter permease [Eubacterium sp.]